MTTKAEELGKRIGMRRALLTLSQQDVAGQISPRQRAGKLQPYTREWLSGVEGGKTEPSLDLLHELAVILKTTPQWLLAGDAVGDSEFVAAMRVFDEDLDDRGRVILLRHAEAEAEQAVLMRRAGLSAEEAELVRLFRQAPAAEQASLLRAAGVAEPRRPRREDGQSQGEENRRERTA